MDIKFLNTEHLEIVQTESHDKRFIFMFAGVFPQQPGYPTKKADENAAKEYIKEQLSRAK